MEGEGKGRIFIEGIGRTAEKREVQRMEMQARRGRGGQEENITMKICQTKIRQSSKVNVFIIKRTGTSCCHSLKHIVSFV